MRTIKAFKVVATFGEKTGYWGNNGQFMVNGAEVPARLFEDRKEAEKLIQDVKNGVAFPGDQLQMAIEETEKQIFEYVVTGTDTRGKRFKITTRTPRGYNIWRGNVWELLENGKRKHCYSVIN